MCRSVLVLVTLIQVLLPATQTVELPPVLTLEQRIKLFGVNESLSMFDFEYASVRQLNGSGLRPFRKRPGTLVYEMMMKNQTFTIYLSPNKFLAAPDCLVKNFSQGVLHLSPCTQTSCFYTGKSVWHNDSWVAASVCGGLHGVISVGNDSLYVLPLTFTDDAQPYLDSRTKDNHIVYKYESGKRLCPTLDTPTPHYRVIQPSLSARFKRAVSQTRYIEARVVADPSMCKFHGKDTKNYVLTVFNIASKLFRKTSIGTDIHLVLSDLVLLNCMEDVDMDISPNASSTLASFCEWQATEEERDNRETQIDVSILLTRINIVKEIWEETTGMAYTEGACINSIKCAIIEDNGPSMGQTIAHEIGHLLGMTHDNTSLNHCPPKIMSAFGFSGEDGYEWSKCSAERLQNFTDRGGLTCLDNEPHGIGDNKDMPPPGIMYNVDKQCEMALRRTARYCVDDSEKDPCENLRCTSTEPGGPCNMFAMALIDGTDCNNSRHWCMEGKCVPIQSSVYIERINGGWSNWDTGFSTCSTTCGGGVKIRRRRCTNPRPQFGGKNCEGENKQAEICNIQACLVNLTMSQCAEIYRPDITDVYYPEPQPYGDDGCNRSCRTQGDPITSEYYHVEGGKFVDGTPCRHRDISVAFSRCVSGKCREFGCDGVMISGKTYDVCGVCDGSGTTCREVSNMFKAKFRYWTSIYWTVVNIPRGSTGVYIEQNNPYVFMSLNIGGRTIFNGNYFRERAIIEDMGMRIMYDVIPEVISIQGPLTNDIVLFTRLKPGLDTDDKEQAYTVSYTYHVTNPGHVAQLYYWAVQEFPCSRTCGKGETSSLIQCWDAEGPVEDVYCDINQKPSEQPKPCNTHPCPPRWASNNWSQCSVSCGNGTNSRNFLCKQFSDGVDEIVDAINCADQAHPPERKNCYDRECPGIWRVELESECSRTCGQGMFIRDSKCYMNGIIVPDIFCLQEEKPDTIVPCNHGSCFASRNCRDKADCGAYGDDICYGYYHPWAEINCPKTCSICSLTDDVQCGVYIKHNVVNQTCHDHPVWTQQHCPNMCKPYVEVCADQPQEGVPCTFINQRYCTDPMYVNYMRAHCPKYCSFC